MSGLCTPVEDVSERGPYLRYVVVGEVSGEAIVETCELVAVEESRGSRAPSKLRTLILLLAVLIAGVWVYFQRYEVIPHPSATNGAVYSVDRWTGDIRMFEVPLEGAYGWSR